MTEILVDPHPPETELRELWLAAWGSPGYDDFAAILAHSLTHLCAYEEGRVVGFVNVAWDGGGHAFLLDTCVHPGFRRRGIATTLVRRATEVARARGVRWLHVDFEPHLAAFYGSCGFRHTEAGLIEL
jgi:ribosomal protein S18 acetylase RimI-like enzyme